ncbi:hypothetical protein OG252_00410 [Streptomyces sp. NBC_01352]|uniref:hypothetical protein n=1 Tax=Streptomyces sp. NBC_01352 TaxID=2903834 RepID=UPI002E34178F|nr:hypothetical protein [Streptomyces sp. NBC_01352]
MSNSDSTPVPAQRDAQDGASDREPRDDADDQAGQPVADGDTSGAFAPREEDVRSGVPSPNEAARDRIAARWAAWGTFISSVAAVAALTFSALATFWLGETTEDQLRQSEAARVDQERSQAGLLSIWTGPDDQNADEYTSYLHVFNRSPDALYEVFAGGDEISVSEWPKDQRPDDSSRRPDAFWYLHTLRPCSTYVDQVEKYEIYSTIYIFFRDSNGNRWVKNDRGVLEQYDRKRHGEYPKLSAKFTLQPPAGKWGDLPFSRCPVAY